MSRSEFIRAEWSQIKSHFKYDIYKWGTVTTVGTMLAIGAWLLHKISWLPDWAPYLAVFVFALIAFIWFSNRLGAPVQSVSSTPSQGITAHQEENKFQNVEDFYNTYDNSMLLETEVLVRKEAQKYAPGNDREGFLIRNLASGAIMYIFDVVWYCVYKSQLLLLEKLNTQTLTTAQVRSYYDEAARAYPEKYQNYPFDQWLNFLRIWFMVVQNGDTFAISVRGKEFLKYLVHQGRSVNDRGL
jgi:hypothetical protein